MWSDKVMNKHNFIILKPQPIKRIELTPFEISTALWYVSKSFIIMNDTSIPFGCPKVTESMNRKKIGCLWMCLTMLYFIICIVSPFSFWSEKLYQMELLWISFFFLVTFFCTYEIFGFCRTIHSIWRVKCEESKHDKSP